MDSIVISDLQASVSEKDQLTSDLNRAQCSIAALKKEVCRLREVEAQLSQTQTDLTALQQRYKKLLQVNKELALAAYPSILEPYISQ